MARDHPTSRQQPPRREHRVLKGLIFSLLLAVVALLSMLAGVYVAVARALPSLQLTEGVAVAETTKIYDDSDPPVLLAELHGLENRESLTVEEVPQVVRDAVVAIEDERFYQHGGVDFWAILRALWANITHGEIVQGGSTITQQLIKNAFLTNEETLDRKLREAALAYQLEKKWSKNKILTEYLNIIYFGEGAYGLEAAARTYFGVDAADLTLDQAALLAGLPQAPSAYSPRRNPEAALARRDVVLNKMYQQGYISSEELQEALSAPLVLADVENTDETRVPYWIEMIREQLLARYGSSTVLQGGLRVYTSIDLDLQEAAEEAVAKILDQPGDPAAALVSIDVRTGRMVAMVGGRDFNALQFNLATQSRRQPGSAFKPFVLVAALKDGLSPDTTYESGPITIDLPSGPWTVSSSDDGPLTLAQAVARSSNGVFARLIMDVGADKVAETAYDMGITTPLGDPPNPAIALGGLTTGVSPVEMAVAYGTLATGGERLESGITFGASYAGYPITIVRVMDARGTILDENSLVQTRVLDADLAAMTTDCLQLVITSGTGTAADIGRPAAGKTGTTQNYADAWFVGYTPELVTAVWVGYPDAQTPMKDVHGIKVTGGSLPARIWAAFMKQALADTPVSQFPAPSEDEWVTVEVCSESHMLPTEYCTKTVTMRFRAGEQPTELCSIHEAEDVPVPDVVGQSLEEATKTLAAAHFLIETVDDDTAPQPAGTVVSQYPDAGTVLSQGSYVTLYVSTGKGTTSVPDSDNSPVTVPQTAPESQESTVKVPDVVGLDISIAEKRLSKLGLVPHQTMVVDVSDAGTVLLQNPDAGTALAVGSAVSLLVSAGPSESTVPQAR